MIVFDRQRVLSVFHALPWPHGKKPTIKYMTDGRTHAVLLHEPVSRGWTDLAEANSITPEGALRGAVEEWLKKKHPKNEPIFHDHLRRTWN